MAQKLNGRQQQWCYVKFRFAFLKNLNNKFTSEAIWHKTFKNEISVNIWSDFHGK